MNPNKKDETDLSINQSNKKNNKISKDLHQSELDNIKHILMDNILFKNISDDVINELVKKFEILYFKEKETVYKENEIGLMFYLIKSGEFEIIKSKDPNSKTIKGESESFGELALIKKTKRTYTVNCVKEGYLYALNRIHFENNVVAAKRRILNERLDFLKVVPIFGFFDVGVLSTIAMSMTNVRFNKGKVIFKEGEKGDSLYIISEGEIECKNENGFKRILKPKDFFGELSILFESTRTKTVSAKSDVICYMITETDLIQNLGKDYKNMFLKSILKYVFKQNIKYNILVNDDYLTALSEKWEISNLCDNQILVTKGEITTDDLKIYIMLAGNLVIKPSNEIITNRFQLFSQCLNLYNNIENDIYTQDNSIILIIKWKSIIEIIDASYINASFEKSFEFFTQLNHMKKVELFKNSTNKLLINICNRMSKEIFTPNEVIFSEGDIGDKFYLLFQGKVALYLNKTKKKEIEEGSFFGERALLSDEKRSGTIKAINNVICYVLKKEDFQASIDVNMLQILNHRMDLQDIFSLKLEDFYYIKDLGKGKFGNVTLVHNNKYHYALKTVNRKAAERQKILIKYFLEERRVLSVIDHPFIMKLVGTLKNENNLFYLIEFIDGITLHKRLEEKRKLCVGLTYYPKKFEVQFYLSFLFVILDYLNARNIIHRDLKPDNLIIALNGYLKLIDFGTAIKISNLTTTITGTPYYISPEVLAGNGYSYSCDYWSVGIIAYEIYYCCYPFGNDAVDPMEVYKEILRKSLTFKSNENSSLNDLIRALLKKNVSQRLCSLELAKKHPFFKNFSWDDLIDFHLDPPYFPKSNVKLNFDSKIPYLSYINSLNAVNHTNEDLLSDYDDDSQNLNNYDSNWADEF